MVAGVGAALSAVPGEGHGRPVDMAGHPDLQALAAAGAKADGQPRIVDGRLTAGTLDREELVLGVRPGLHDHSPRLDLIDVGEYDRGRRVIHRYAEGDVAGVRRELVPAG